jgi:hypothetical protein
MLAKLNKVFWSVFPYLTILAWSGLSLATLHWINLAPKYSLAVNFGVSTVLFLLAVHPEDICNYNDIKMKKWPGSLSLAKYASIIWIMIAAWIFAICQPQIWTASPRHHFSPLLCAMIGYDIFTIAVIWWHSRKFCHEIMLRF